MIDTNVVLVLTNGWEIPVVYPRRIGREYETPWLDVKGFREWNIDVVDSVNSIRLGDPRFIVGKWGSSFGSSEGVDQVVPFHNFARIRDLSPEDQARANMARVDEELLAQKLWDETRPITRAEFSALERRVKNLEKDFSE